MEVKNNKQLVIIQLEELEEILNPIYSKLELIENKIGITKLQTTSYYRNKDLKQFFGLSDNTILKYRETGVIPYTFLDNIFLYPIDEIEKILQENSNWELFNIAS